MNMKKAIWPLMLVTAVFVVLCSGFLFKSKPKETEIQSETLTEQDDKISALEAQIAEQKTILTAQDKKLAEIAGITDRVDKIQAALNTREVNINASDMAKLQQQIEQQVKLNVTKAEMPAIGVVSIRKIFRDCKKAAQYREQTNAERQQLTAELTKLDNEIKAQREGLKTLKVGSENYLAQVKELLEKQARMQAQQEFHKQQLTIQEQQLTENIYKDILRITSDIAKQKNLDLVLEASEPDLPASNPTELELSMGTHKLLYGGGCQDITEDVMAQLDSEK